MINLILYIGNIICYYSIYMSDNKSETECESCQKVKEYEQVLRLIYKLIDELDLGLLDNDSDDEVVENHSKSKPIEIKKS